VSTVAYRTEPVNLLASILATARRYLQDVSAYLIQLVRWPLGPLFMFATWRITYSASGRTSADGATLSGFLLVGIFGTILWSSSIWGSGYAIQNERDDGTSGSLFLTPVNRAAVVGGYGLGSFVWFLPSFVAVGVLGWVTGARFDVHAPWAVVLAVVALCIASLAAGFTFSGLFILTRRGNLVANVIQSPIFLLGGLMVPLSALPDWLRPLSDAIPVTHAVVALRESTLLGAGMGATLHDVLLSLIASAAWFVIGLIGLWRVEDVAKRLGQLDLY
jgi:ABC-2 type transport system permease protein